ncbi:MAG: phage tail tape measure protein [Pseudomonadota bacterium]
MSSGGLVAELVLKYKDSASAAATRSLKAIDQGLKGVTQSGKQAKSASEAAIGTFARMASARSVLGIRSEKEVQNEIRRTEAAYQRLAQSGSASQRELARASDASRQKVAQLREELAKTNRLGSALRGVGMGVAAYQAAKYAVADPIRQTMDRSMTLARISNMAFSERDKAGRLAGKDEIEAQIAAATRSGGGTRESATDALATLIADWQQVGPNAMPFKSVLGMLPAITKAGSASGSDPNDLAKVAIRATQNFGIKSGEVGGLLNMLARAGKEGGFEIKDMARWLPAQMATAKLSGMSGPAGMAKLLALNQTAAITAGSRDEAGNNVVNLLAKLNSRDTAMDAKRLGIDLSGTLAAARGKGIDSVDAFVGIVDRVTAKDKKYQALRQQLKTATGTERQGILSSQADILEGSAIGQIVQDRQALSALVGYMSNRGFGSAVEKKVMGEFTAAPGQGSNDADFSVVSSEPAFQAQQMATEKAIAMQTALDKVNPLLGGMADTLTGLMRDFPLLSASVIGATTALTALALAAGAAGLTSLMTGGSGGAAVNVAKKVLTLGGLVPAVGGAFATLGGGGGLGAGIAGAGLLAAGGAGYAIGSGLNWLGDKAVSAATGGTNDSMGGLLYDLLHREKEPTRVIVEVQNGNVVASVNETNSRQAKRH